MTAPRHLLSMGELAENDWAACGPASLAALLGRPLADLRPAFPRQHNGRTWTSHGDMVEAVRRLDLQIGAIFGAPSRFPRHGLALIQFRGSWDALPVDHPAQLQRTHWVAVAPPGHKVGAEWLTQPAVFDVNLVEAPGVEEQHGWTTHDAWGQVMAPKLAKGYGRTATGEWWVRAGFEVKERSGEA